jgi:hypothetical protein
MSWGLCCHSSHTVKSILTVNFLKGGSAVNVLESMESFISYYLILRNGYRTPNWICCQDEKESNRDTLVYLVLAGEGRVGFLYCFIARTEWLPEEQQGESKNYKATQSRKVTTALHCFFWKYKFHASALL